MSREEAWNRIDAIIARHEIDDDYVTITSILDYDALRMARKALEQEPRKITYEDVKGYCKPRCLTIIDNELLYELTHPKIKALEEEPKTGHWTHDGSHWKNRFICSKCGYKLFDEQTNFCPNCGAKMIEPQESEDKE